MKKHFLLTGLFFGFLTSCTNNEVINISQEQNSIRFKVPFVTNVTRTVSDVTTNAVTSIHAFGIYTNINNTTWIKNETYDIDYCFENTHVKSESGFDTGVEWIENKLYSFAAYINGTDNVCITNPEEEPKVVFLSVK